MFRKKAKLGPPPDRTSEAAIRVSKRGTLFIDSSVVKKVGRKLAWLPILAAGGGGLWKAITYFWR